MSRINRIISGHVKYLCISISVYILGIIFGMIISADTKLTINPTSMQFVETFVHNEIIGLGLVVFGIVTFGFFNTIFLAYNGFSLGLIIIGVYNQYGISPLISGVAPHALIETFAITMSCTLGYESLRLVKMVKNNLDSDIKGKIYISDFIILLISTSLLYVVGAFIESSFSNVII